MWTDPKEAIRGFLKEWDSRENEIDRKILKKTRKGDNAFRKQVNKERPYRHYMFFLDLMDSLIQAAKRAKAEKAE